MDAEFVNKVVCGGRENISFVTAQGFANAAVRLYVFWKCRFAQFKADQVAERNQQLLTCFAAIFHHELKMSFVK